MLQCYHKHAHATSEPQKGKETTQKHDVAVSGHNADSIGEEDLGYLMNDDTDHLWNDPTCTTA